MSSTPDPEDSLVTKQLSRRPEGSQEPQLRCPHCRQSVAGTAESAPFTCAACGKNFRVSNAEQKSPLRAGELFDRFVLLECVGAGTFGIVWKARDVQLDRVVALKIPHQSWLSTPTNLKRIEREARAAAALEHPNILKLFNVAIIDDVPILISEFILGGTLEKWLSEHQPSFREASEWAIALALGCAHKSGLVHRDVKPGNILLEQKAGSKSHRPILIDFGLAVRDEVAIVLTMEGQILGTPAYMSPEQALGKNKEVGPRSDIYSLGVVLYKMVTSVLPYHGPPARQIELAAKGEPRWPREINPHIPRDLETIILRAMAREPDRRFESAQAFADDLRRHLANRPILSRPVGRVERGLLWARRNPALATAWGIAVLFCVALLAASLLINVKQHEIYLQQEEFSAQQSEYIQQLQAKSAWEAFEAGMGKGRDYEHVDESLFSFLRAVKETPPRERNLERLARLNLPAWESKLLKLEGLGTLPAKSFTTQIAARRLGTGDELAVLGSDGQLLLWKHGPAVDQPQVLIPKGETCCFAFSSDWRQLATGDRKSVVRIYDVHEEKVEELATAPIASQSFIHALAFSASGQRLAIGTQKGTRILEVAKAKTIAPTLLSNDERIVAALWFTSEDSLITQAGGQLVRWNLAAKPLEREVLTTVLHSIGGNMRSAVQGDLIVYPHDKQVDFIHAKKKLPSIELAGMPEFLALSPDGQILATVINQRQLQLWYVETGRPLTAPQNYRHRIKDIAFHPSSEAIFVADDNQTVRRLGNFRSDYGDAGNSRELHPMAGVRWLEFTPDGNRLMAASSGTSDHPQASIQLWANPAWSPVGAAAVQSGVISPQLSPNGKLLAHCRSAGSIVVDEVDSGNQVFAVPDSSRTYRTTWADQGENLIVDGPSGVVRMWNVKSRSQCFADLQHDSFVNALAVSPDRTKLIVGTTSGQMKVWNLETGRLLYTCAAMHDSIHMAVFSPDSRFFLAAGHESVVRIFNAANGALVGQELPHLGVARSAAWSRDGATIATGGDDHLVRQWDARTGMLLATPIDLGTAVYAVAFSNDGSSILAFSSAGRAGLWDAATCRPIGAPFEQGAKIYSVAFHPEGRFVAAGDQKGSIRFWPVPEPLQGDYERLRLWVQVATGLESDPGTGGLELTPREWAEKKRQLEQLNAQ